MSFKEKSAWIMLVAIGLSSSMYFYLIYQQTVDGVFPMPDTPSIITYTVLQICLIIIGHIVISAAKPKEAVMINDEREQQIEHTSARHAGLVFSTTIALSLAGYFFKPDGNMLFYAVFASLIVSNMVNYAIQLVLHRRY